MSFGPSNTVKRAENNLGGLSNQATNLSTAETNQAQNLVGAGLPSITAGTNFFNTLLNGNQANTSALLAPSIEQIRGGNQNTLQALSTLMPRGGGRSGTLFGASYAPESQISNLFNTGRVAGATALPQIGSTLLGAGTNLFGIGNQPLSAAAGANAQLGNLGQQQQQMSNSLFGGIGSGLMGLALAPVSGGGSLLPSLLGF